MLRSLALAAALVFAGCHRTPEDLVEAADRQAALQSYTAMHEAIAGYQRALPRFSDPAAQARIHAKLAETYASLDATKAKPELQEAIRLATAAGDTEAALVSRADLALDDGTSLETRIATLRGLVSEAHAAGAGRAELRASKNLGMRLVSARQLTEALAVLTGAAELARARRDAGSVAELELRIGAATIALGDADHALPRVRRAVEMARAIRRPLLEADATNVLGLAYLWLVQDRAQALIYLTRALVIETELGMAGVGDGINARLGVGQAQGLLGDKAAAVATLEVALTDARASGQESQLLGVLNAIAPLYTTTGRNADARQVLTQSLALARKLEQTHQEDLALISIARLDVTERRWKEAEDAIAVFLDHIGAKEAAVTDEKLRLSFTGALRNGQEVLLQALAGEEDWNRAFASSERLRSRRLLAALGGIDIVDGDGARAVLDADTTLIEYAFAGTRLYAFVGDAAALQGVDLGPAKAVQDRARAWYELASAAAPAPGALAAATRALADLVLTPLAPRLHGKRLLIVPDKALHYVAFAALPLPDGAALIQRFEVVHAPSVSVLRELRRRSDSRPRPTRELAILADPIFDRSDGRLGGAAPPAPLQAAARGANGTAADVPRLPWTHAEAEAIAALAPAGKVFRVEGAAATRAAALGPEVAGARYVHYATHALLDNVDPEQSGLVFTQIGPAGAAVDGFIRAPDIERAHLSAELVVLSACRTAMGKSFDGEGLVSLTRAFLIAGVPRVVSSLWLVDDAATAGLMARFYQGLIADHLAPPAALRRAQLEAGADRAAPLRMWAGFAFYGDWR